MPTGLCMLYRSENHGFERRAEGYKVATTVAIREQRRGVVCTGGTAWAGIVSEIRRTSPGGGRRRLQREQERQKHVVVPSREFAWGPVVKIQSAL